MTFRKYLELWRVAFCGGSAWSRFVARLGIIVVHAIVAAGIIGIAEVVVSIRR